MEAGLLRVLRAAETASRWHVAQRRKGDAQEPYINHLLEVAQLVGEATGGRDPDLVVAALLHDAIEDCEIQPATIEAEVDDLLSIVAESRTGELGPMMRRLEGQGVNPVTLCIATLRHFRALHAASADPGGPAAGIARMRPPIFGPRRDRMLRQAQNWGMERLEQALSTIIETDLTLRSTSRAPAMAVMERALIRLAMMNRR